MSRLHSKSLSYVLGVNENDKSHVLPINTIRSNETHLFTGGRDGVVASYDNHTNNISHGQIHTDWVNDIQLFNENSLVSCSSDLSVKLWNYELNKFELIGHHHDYVKSLAISNSGSIITGGLDRFINIWDVTQKTKIGAFENKLDNDKGSIYSISSNKQTGLVAFGDNDSNIQLFDPNTFKPIVALNGHTDTIKSLIVGENYLLSGSSDKKVNLWDLRTNHILKSFNFENSIWSLYSDDLEFNEFYTGDSQGRLYHTNQDLTRVIGSGSRGVLSINKFQDEIWSSSMENSNLTNWTTPIKTIEGDYGMIKARLLNNRRYVVTLSTSEEVKLWDIVKGIELRNFGNNVGFEDVIDKYQTEEILPTWCRVSIKAGRLFISLSESSYLNTELYGDDFEEYGLKLDPETRFSIGKIVIQSIFQKFIQYQLKKDNDLREQRIKDIKGVSKLHILSKLSSHDSTPIQSLPQSAAQTPIDEHKTFFSDKLSDTLSSLPPSSAPAVLTQESEPINISTKQKKDENGTSTPSSFRKLRLFGKKSKTQVPISEEQLNNESDLQPPPPQTAPNLSNNINNNDTTTTEPKESQLTQQLQSLQLNQTNGTDNQSNKSQPNSEPGSKDPSRKSSNVEIEDTFQSVLNEIKSIYDSLHHVHQLHNTQLTPLPHADAPIIELPNDLIIIINERIGGSSNEIDLYSEFLDDLKFPILEQFLPKWIGNLLLKNKYNIKEFPKVGFTISRHPNITNVPNITNGNCRLNAYNMLRVRRILTYITDRMESKTSEMQHHVKAEEWLEVLCNDEVLPETMTLATLKATRWKTSGDIQITYRRKNESSK
ncbi:putative WD repeat-containing protein [Wickerhamomyces ciferrii]|uniref:WD repeat-containing protein n=1 Tax=Wickerhamomyces ciferrii (strain ATCC 14091 / BCRC 22168 / CBS 111 / JCM 3599 / NBRC 0793 / NRRL Y-1031 F-60-10) TaxID=1206466 RepID=K0KKQ6_WICCF|nr:putative WD repeat-containing protein [Wickerhamomyces ciferrii]CCH42737.1 putative WD repeat-containing protein [Wickerhamomyces ciferrii]